MANPNDPRVRGVGRKTNPAEGSKPTPTQDENDRFALGEHIMEHEKDGSEEQEPVVAPTRESLKTATDKSRADAQERLSKGRPTLTQEENDTAAIEGFVAAGEHSDDGSGPDPVVTRNLEAYKPSGAYQTRSASSARRTTPAAAPPKSE